MKLTKITVHAGVTFNHPFESYSNFRYGVSLEASPEETDDDEQITRLSAELQNYANAHVEAQKKAKLEALAELDAAQVCGIS